MHRSRLSTFVIDSKMDVDQAARFWSAALGRAIKPVKPDDGAYRELVTDAGEPMVLVQQIDHEARVHVDIESDDLDAEVARLVALGAKHVELVKRWHVMEAPTGHRFCVVNPQRGSLEGAPGVTEWP